MLSHTNRPTILASDPTPPHPPILVRRTSSAEWRNTRFQLTLGVRGKFSEYRSVGATSRYNISTIRGGAPASIKQASRGCSPQKTTTKGSGKRRRTGESDVARVAHRLIHWLALYHPSPPSPRMIRISMTVRHTDTHTHTNEAYPNKHHTNTRRYLSCAAHGCAHERSPPPTTPAS